MDDFIKKIKNSNVSNIPFKNICIDNIFNFEFYKNLSNELDILDINLFKVDNFSQVNDLHSVHQYFIPSFLPKLNLHGCEGC